MVAILNPSPTSAVADRILRVAKSIVEASGEAALRIDAVMDGAAVQAPVIYRHFGSREGLVQSAHLARYIENIVDVFGYFTANSIAAADASEFRVAFDRMLDSLLGAETVEITAARLEVLAAGLKRPGLSNRIREIQGSSLAAPIAALEFAQSKGWVRTDIAIDEFVVWAMSSTVGQAAVARFRDEPGLAERWAKNHRLAIESVLFGA